MSNYLVDGADLTSVANAIRTKGGTSAQLAFPDGFVSAVQAIETGGAAPTLVTKTITENGTYNAASDNADGYSSVTVNVQGSGGYANDDFADRTKPVGVVNVPADVREGSGENNLKWQYLLAGRVGITTVNFPYTTIIPTGFCLRCTGITQINVPLVTTLFGNAFQLCSRLVYAVFPKLRSFQGNSAFASCTSLAAADFGGNASASQARDGFYSAYTFNGCTSLKTLILRGNEVWKLGTVNTFNNTPFASGKAGGTLYVPQDLIASYQAATNWSTILGYGSGAQNQILPIEGSIYETQYADGTAIPTT